MSPGRGPRATLASGAAELWRCPDCGARFTTRNAWHSCGRFDLEDRFAGAEPAVRRLFESLRRAIERFGPVIVIPQKTRIVFQVRMRFAAIVPRKTYLRGHLVLRRRVSSRRFERVDSLAPRAHVHVFRLRSEAELDAEFLRLVRESYEAGGGGAQDGARSSGRGDAARGRRRATPAA